MCRTNCGGGGGGGKEGMGVEGRGENHPQTGTADDRHIAVLLEPSEATFKASAFYFTDATVRYVIFSNLVAFFVTCSALKICLVLLCYITVEH